MQLTTPWHADEIGAGRAQHAHGGKQEANGGKLAFIRTVQAFTCHGVGRQVARATPSFIQSTFTSHTGSLLLSLYAPRYCLTASAGFGRQFAKLRALSRLRRRYDSRKKRTPFVPLVPAPSAAHPGQLHVQARKDALFQPGDVALRYPQRVGNLLLRHLPRAAQTKAQLHDLLLAQGQARQRRAQ